MLTNILLGSIFLILCFIAFMIFVMGRTLDENKKN